MSVLFFFQGISVDMDVCEPIQKISSFITHYQDHKVYGDSFFEYVLEDYFDNEVNNKGHHNNSDKENMPVHSHQQYYHPVVFIANTSIAVFNLLKFEEKKQFNSYTFNFNSIFLESLFQPPQV
mgnify:FL=1